MEDEGIKIVDTVSFAVAENWVAFVALNFISSVDDRVKPEIVGHEQLLVQISGNVLG